LFLNDDAHRLNQYSHDCNAFVTNNSVYLRISILENAYAFHVSEDARTWNLIRYFTLEGIRNPQIGFLAQSPTGNGCAAAFDEIRFEERLLADIRSGE
jgi:hypothetical protein